MVQDFSDALGLKIWATWKLVVFSNFLWFFKFSEMLRCSDLDRSGNAQNRTHLLFVGGLPTTIHSRLHEIVSIVRPDLHHFYEPCRCGAAVRHMKKLQPCLDAPDRAAHPATASFSETRNV